MADITLESGVKEIVARYADALKGRYRIRYVYVFGSVARGNARDDSDIDVAVVADDFTGDPVDYRLELMKLRRGIDLRIEPLPFLARDFGPANPLAKDVMKTGIRIR